MTTGAGAVADEAAPIVVGVNGSLEALHAAHWAGAVAERLCVALHILTATPHVGRTLTDAMAAIRTAAIVDHRESADRILEATKESVLEDHPGVAVTTFSLAVPADEALCATSRTARLLVSWAATTSPPWVSFSSD